MSLVVYKCNDDKLAEMLELTRWAKDFSWEQICNISKQMDAYKANKGDLIFEEGSSDNTMGIVVKGKIDIVKDDADHNRKVIATLMPSQSFGEMSLIDGEPRSAGVVASTDVVLLFLTKDKMFELVNTKPALAFKLIWLISQMLSQRLRKTSGSLVEYLEKTD
ncbi:MAG: cyclic nucleotide-binding domain-containing protein [Gammaproteobacteria bacterium]|nr:cyclic nucleotide-binding domain-containing protein [Gammaproteobacteria bacterium]MCW8910447.1 cyclic nucleotide-binding domain-containing protein [Gammaproteobacteria bacterium]MCW9004890.1 cyclic nucleotide-binding domain-containing protein [Gammaproteobacteria bacterium]